MASRRSNSNPSRSDPPLMRSGVVTRAQARALRETEARQTVVAFLQMAVARARYGAELKAERKAVLYGRMQVSLGIMCEYFFSGPLRAGGLEMEDAARLFLTSRNPPCTREMLKRAVNHRSQVEAQAFFDRYVLYYEYKTRDPQPHFETPILRLVRPSESVAYIMCGVLVDMNEYPDDLVARYSDYIYIDEIDSKLTLDKERGVVKFYDPCRSFNIDIRFSPLPSGLRRRCIFEGTLVCVWTDREDDHDNSDREDNHDDLGRDAHRDDWGLISRFRVQRFYPHSLIYALTEFIKSYTLPDYTISVFTCFDGERQVPCLSVTFNAGPNPIWTILTSTYHAENDPLNLGGWTVDSYGPLPIHRLQRIVDSLFPGEFHLVADGAAGGGGAGGGGANAPGGVEDDVGN